ncbi:hypothetical protein ES703_82623 [subsurface metagenome]
MPAQLGIFGFEVIQRAQSLLFFRIEEVSFCIINRFCFNSLYKEDYYVQENDLFGFFCFGAGPGSDEHS